MITQWLIPSVTLEYGPGDSSRCEEYRLLIIRYYSLRSTLFKYSNNADFISLLSFFRSCEFHYVLG